MELDSSRRVPWFVYLIASLSVLLLVLFVPNGHLEDSSIQVGDVWNEEDLVATRDVPMQDSSRRMRALYKSVDGEVPPVYRLEGDPLTTLLAQTKTMKGAGTEADSLSEILKELTVAEDIAREAYATGVIAQPIDAEEVMVLDAKSARYIKGPDLTSTAALRKRWLDSGVSEDLIRVFEGLASPNLISDPQLREDYIEEKVRERARSLETRKGDLLVENGQVIDAVTKERIAQYRAMSSGGKMNAVNYWRFFGYVLVFLLVITVFVLYIRNHDFAILEQPSRTIFMLIWPVLFAMFTFFVERSGDLSAYLIPFCIVPIIVRSFTHSRLALFAHVVVVLIVSVISKLGYEFTFLQILAGIVAVLFVRETRDWSEFFRSLLFILVSYCLGYFGLTLILEGNPLDLNLKIYGWFLLNVVLLLLAYPLIPLMERIFGFTTTIRLNELADLSQPLLRELSITAPGTLQHSLQVSNLSQAAAEAIGCNVDLIKVAALYHDVGKMKQPSCFIENQSGNNPHDEWSNFESAGNIIGHVTEGVKMAKAAKLPEEIIEFIETHHGNTRVEYFYRKQLADFPEREFDETLFRYPGPRPFTKEQAILMIADSLEAASKSLKSPTGQDIDNLVDKIIDGKIKGGQLDESPLTFEDLRKCTEVFKRMLRSINHVRVEYPDEPSSKPKASD